MKERKYSILYLYFRSEDKLPGRRTGVNYDCKSVQDILGKLILHNAVNYLNFQLLFLSSFTTTEPNFFLDALVPQFRPREDIVDSVHQAVSGEPTNGNLNPEILEQVCHTHILIVY